MPRIMIDHGYLFRLKPRWIHAPRSDSNPIGQLSGFIYVLINQSLDGLVKIGKTTRSPVNRVSELSSATGVPTPFHLVYWAEFGDCDSAERAIHKIFTERGTRVSDNREFFRVPTHEAISAVISLQQGMLLPEHNLQPIQTNCENLSNNVSLIENLIRDACEHLSGEGGKFQDTSKAIEIFKKACELGSVDGCKHLGSIYRDYEINRDLRKSKNYLLRGVELGSLECYAELGQTFLMIGEKKNSENAWKQFLERAASLSEPIRSIYCMQCIQQIINQSLEPNLLPLLRPYAKDIVRALELTILHCDLNESDIAKHYQRMLAVTKYLLLDILSTPHDAQTGRIRYINNYDGGGWITGDDGKEYEFINVLGIPALGRAVFFTGIFPHVLNYGKAENVVMLAAV